MIEEFSGLQDGLFFWTGLIAWGLAGFAFLTMIMTRVLTWFLRHFKVYTVVLQWYVDKLKEKSNAANKTNVS